MWRTWRTGGTGGKLSGCSCIQGKRLGREFSSAELVAAAAVEATAGSTEAVSLQLVIGLLANTFVSTKNSNVQKYEYLTKRVRGWWHSVKRVFAAGARVLARWGLCACGVRKSQATSGNARTHIRVPFYRTLTHSDSHLHFLTPLGRLVTG